MFETVDEPEPDLGLTTSTGGSQSDLVLPSRNDHWPAPVAPVGQAVSEGVPPVPPPRRPTASTGGEPQPETTAEELLAAEVAQLRAQLVEQARLLEAHGTYTGNPPLVEMIWAILTDCL